MLWSLTLLACAPVDVDVDVDVDTPSAQSSAADSLLPDQGVQSRCQRRAEVPDAPLSEDLEDLRARFVANQDLVRVVAITAPG